MNRHFLPFLFILSFSTSIFSQTWVRQYPLEKLAFINSIDMLPSGDGFAVGDDGLLMRTNDFGQTWFFQNEPTVDVNFNAVSASVNSNGQVALAGGQELIRTTDGGANWQIIDLRALGANPSTIREINVVNDQLHYVMGSKLIKTTDGGASWTIITPDGTTALRAITVLDDQNILLADQSNVYKSTDGGSSWTTLTNANNEFRGISDMKFANENKGWVLDFTREFYGTTDGGVSWTKLGDDLPYGSQNFVVIDENTLWISFINAVIPGGKSTDGGLTWESFRPDLPQAYHRAIDALDADRVWITAQYSSIHHTPDGGQTWSGQTAGFKRTLNGVTFHDESFGVACGFDGVVVRTEDGGAIWTDQQLTSTGSARGFEAIELRNPNDIWVTGGPGTYHSTDRGQTWTRTTGSGGFSMWLATDPQTLFLGDLSSGKLYKSTDGNQTSVTVLEHTTVSRVEDIHFLNDQIGWAVGTNRFLYKTIDGGSNWELKSIPSEGSYSNVVARSEQEIWVVEGTRTDTLWKTFDGGDTWSPIALPAGKAHDLIVVSDQEAYYSSGVATRGNVYKSVDNGQTWDLDYEGVDPLYNLSIPTTSTESVWVTGSGGTILKRVDCGISPTLSDLTADQTPCIGDTLVLEVVSNGVAVFDWDIPMDYTLISNANSGLIKVLVGEDAGLFSVVGSNTCVNSNQLSVQVNPVESPDAPDITLTDNILSTTDLGDQYLWYLDGQLIAVTTTPEYTIRFSGEYTLRTRTGNCESKFSDSVQAMIVSTQNFIDAGFELFPNPAGDHIMIKSPAHASLQLNYQWYDMQGRLSKEGILSTSQIPSRLDISNFNAGVYMLKLTTSEKSYITKVVKK